MEMCGVDIGQICMGSFDNHEACQINVFVSLFITCRFVPMELGYL